MSEAVRRYIAYVGTLGTTQLLLRIIGSRASNKLQGGFDLKMFTIPDVERAYNLLHEANVIMLKVWLKEIVFTWRWWLEIG